jgi:hypothetical protein
VCMCVFVHVRHLCSLQNVHWQASYALRALRALEPEPLEEEVRHVEPVGPHVEHPHSLVSQATHGAAAVQPPVIVVQDLKQPRVPGDTHTHTHSLTHS